MEVIIQKYGGTSVNSPVLRNKIVDNLRKVHSEGLKSVIVVSAMGRMGSPYATDTLQCLIPSTHKDTRTMDMLLASGEIISTAVIAAHLKDHGFDAICLTGGQAGILTDSNFGEAKVLNVNPNYLEQLLKEGKVPVVAGFQGQNDKGEFTTLGRGGSDTSAVLLGIALKAKSVEIFTDVDGVMTADPKLVPNAKLIEEINYDEVFQLAQYGAKVIHPNAVDLAMKHSIPLRVVNPIKYGSCSGTLINSIAGRSQNLVTAIAHEHGKVQWKLEIEPKDKYIFKEIANHGISIDMINIFLDYGVFITNEEAKDTLQTLLDEHNINYNFNTDCTKITVIGSKIRGVPGVMAKVIEALKKDIEILQTSDSHTTISILVPTPKANEAVNLLHQSFQLGN